MHLEHRNGQRGKADNQPFVYTAPAGASGTGGVGWGGVAWDGEDLGERTELMVNWSLVPSWVTGCGLLATWLRTGYHPCLERDSDFMCYQKHPYTALSTRTSDFVANAPLRQTLKLNSDAP
jgi:hypothetical protein